MHKWVHKHRCTLGSLPLIIRHDPAWPEKDQAEDRGLCVPTLRVQWLRSKLRAVIRHFFDHKNWLTVFIYPGIEPETSWPAVAYTNHYTYYLYINDGSLLLMWYVYINLYRFSEFSNIWGFRIVNHHSFYLVVIFLIYQVVMNFYIILQKGRQVVL